MNERFTTMWSIEKLLEKLRNVSNESKLDDAKRTTTSALWLFLASWFSLSSFRFGIFLWCWHQLRIWSENFSIHTNRLCFQNLIRLMGIYVTNVIDEISYTFEDFQLMHLAVIWTEIPPAVFTIKIAKRTQRGPQFIKSFISEFFFHLEACKFIKTEASKRFQRRSDSFCSCTNKFNGLWKFKQWPSFSAIFGFHC